jgi:hypothetical protein
MSHRVRAELDALLRKSAEQRRKLKGIQADLEQLDVRIGRVRSHTAGKPEPRPNNRKASRKK